VSEIGDFTGTRHLYEAEMSDTPFGRRSTHTVSVVETAGHAPLEPTLTDAERRARARKAYDAARGRAPTVPVYSCPSCGCSTLSLGPCPGCFVPEVRSCVDPKEQYAHIDRALVTFTAWQRDERPGPLLADPTTASMAWSDRLRVLQREARHKELHEVVIDLDWD
jgi:hypothetical protein